MIHTPLTGLKAMRRKHGFTQAALANIIDVNQSQYLKLETGAVRLDVHRAKLLAVYLGCAIDDLL